MAGLPSIDPANVRQDPRQDLRQISSVWTCYEKKIWPTFLLVVVGWPCVWSLLLTFQEPAAFPLVVGSFAMFLLCLRSMWTLCFRLVDQVWLDDGMIVVRNHGRLDRFPVTDISKITYRRSGPEHVELALRTPCLFGSTILFMPTLGDLSNLHQHPVVDELSCLSRGGTYNDSHAASVRENPRENPRENEDAIKILDDARITRKS